VALLAAGSLATWSPHFGSDLDIIAVAADERSTPRKDAIIHALLDDARAMRLGPIDLRLRGEGKSAPLVQTLDYYESYFQTRASLWEIIAYSKCRFIRGDAETGRAFEEMLARTLPVLFSREGWKERLLETRAKLESLSKGAWDVKHAAGGLYDIGFLLSAARLLGLLGPAVPAVQTGRREELERLREAGLLEAGDPATLLGAYRVFWTIEHAAALHGIPYPPSSGRENFFESYFGRLFGDIVKGEGTFLGRLEGLKRDVREIFDRFLERTA
jgi:glutamine synthetase adenylyltransferase